MNVTRKPLWCVRNPSPVSEMSDIVFPMTMAALPRYVLGTGMATYEAEDHAFYDDEEEARTDARGRMARRPA